MERSASMTVWVDLDETLIASSETPRLGWIRLGSERWAILRPGARKCLTALRAIGRVRLLTSARLIYATEASVRFALGFTREQIAAQEDWTSLLRAPPSLGRPHDVLVEDNQSRTVLEKCRYIGIGLDRVIVVPAYSGGTDDVLLFVPHRIKHLLGESTAE